MVAAMFLLEIAVNGGYVPISENRTEGSVSTVSTINHNPQEVVLTGKKKSVDRSGASSCLRMTMLER